MKYSTACSYIIISIGSAVWGNNPFDNLWAWFGLLVVKASGQALSMRKGLKSILVVIQGEWSKQGLNRWIPISAHIAVGVDDSSTNRLGSASSVAERPACMGWSRVRSPVWPFRTKSDTVSELG